MHDGGLREVVERGWLKSETLSENTKNLICILQYFGGTVELPVSMRRKTTVDRLFCRKRNSCKAEKAVRVIPAMKKRFVFDIYNLL